MLLYVLLVRLPLVSAVEFAPELPPDSPERRDNPATWTGYQPAILGWIAGAKALALLSGAVDSGVIDALRTKSTAQEIADATGTGKDRVIDLCVALELHGVVQRDGDHYELTPRYALLASPTAAIPLPAVIRYAEVMTRVIWKSDVEWEATYSEPLRPTPV